MAQGHDTGRTCKPIDVCQNCAPGQGCSAVSNYTVFDVDEHGLVNGEDNMKAEIYINGPIACTVAVTDEFEAYNGTYVFEDFSGDVSKDHSISVVGWGVSEDGVPYWIGRNR